MTQCLKRSDGSHMPDGLSVVNMYTKVTSGSKQVVVVVKNLMAFEITITNGVKITKVVAANALSLVEVMLGTLENLYEV